MEARNENTALDLAGECESVELTVALRIAGFSKPTGWRLIKNPASGFPKPFRLDPSNPRSRLRIRLAELFRWIERQQQATAEAARDGVYTNAVAAR